MWLAVKFLLKSFSSPTSVIFQTFVDVFHSRINLSKCLASVVSSMSPFISIIFRPHNYLFLYDVLNYLITNVSINLFFLAPLLAVIHFISIQSVNNLFYSYISSKFCILYMVWSTPNQ